MQAEVRDMRVMFLNKLEEFEEIDERMQIKLKTSLEEEGQKEKNQELEKQMYKLEGIVADRGMKMDLMIAEINYLRKKQTDNMAL